MTSWRLTTRPAYPTQTKRGALESFTSRATLTPVRLTGCVEMKLDILAASCYHAINTIVGTQANGRNCERFHSQHRNRTRRQRREQQDEGTTAEVNRPNSSRPSNTAVGIPQPPEHGLEFGSRRSQTNRNIVIFSHRSALLVSKVQSDISSEKSLSTFRTTFDFLKSGKE